MTFINTYCGTLGRGPAPDDVETTTARLRRFTHTDPLIVARFYQFANVGGFSTTSLSVSVAMEPETARELIAELTAALERLDSGKEGDDDESFERICVVCGGGFDDDQDRYLARSTGFKHFFCGG